MANFEESITTSLSLASWLSSHYEFEIISDYSFTLFDRYKGSHPLKDSVISGFYFYDSNYAFKYSSISDLLAYGASVSYDLIIKNNVFDRLSYSDYRFYSINSRIKDLLRLSDRRKTTLSSYLSSYLFYSSLIGIGYSFFLSDILTIYDRSGNKLLSNAYDGISYFDSLKPAIVVDIKDLLKIYSSFNVIRSLFKSFYDFISFIDDISEKSSVIEGVVLFVIDPLTAEKGQVILWYLYSTNISITGCDGIVTAEDGIYVFIDERQAGDIVFNLSDFNSSRLKKIDKIHSNVPLYSATVYADGEVFSFDGELWVNCAKGLKARDLKVWLDNVENLEFVSFRIATTERAKK